MMQTFKSFVLHFILLTKTAKGQHICNTILWRYFRSCLSIFRLKICCDVVTCFCLHVWLFLGGGECWSLCNFSYYCGFLLSVLLYFGFYIHAIMYHSWYLVLIFKVVGFYAHNTFSDYLFIHFIFTLNRK